MPTRVPKGNRVLVMMSIPGANTAGVVGPDDDADDKFYIRLKEGTAKELGLTPVIEIPEGRNGKGIKRGVKGTKSVQLFLKTATSIGGVTVKTLEMPIPSKLSLREFYKYAKANLATKIKGFASPDGIRYFFEAESAPTP